jgi:DNA-binding NtrC family response regulator
VPAISQPGKLPDAAEESPLLRILVVDDEPLIRWSLVQTLSDCGHQTMEAMDGAAAIRAISEASRPFDVALLDFRLPDSNDLTLLTCLRRLSPRTQFILMTAFGTTEVVQRALDLGVFRVVAKPLDMDDVGALVAGARAAAPKTKSAR